MKNRKNNKGFSLVELIVVVAIMAVLVGVLAPAYLKYVENSREKKDLNNIEEVRHAVEIALADEDVYSAIDDSTAVQIDADGDVSVTGTDTDGKLAAEVTSSVGAKVELVSKKYTTTQTIEINISGTTVKVECTPAVNS